MEIKIKNKNKIKREGSTWNQKMKYFKIPLCRNFHWNIRVQSGSSDTCQWYLRSKIGVWQSAFHPHHLCAWFFGGSL